jgi:hypothetical protein
MVALPTDLESISSERSSALGAVLKPGSWIHHLPSVIWADQITVRKSIGFTPYRMALRQEYLLPVDLAEESWGVIKWREVEKGKDGRGVLLALRARQLERRKDGLEEAVEV